MIRNLVIRRRALAEIQHTRNEYNQLGHGGRFFDELELVLEAIRAMPLRFPVVHGPIHRALLRRYPYALFFRIRRSTMTIVILALVHQRRDPATWPRP
ncbi:MAG TPA: type II toxin-antitoxin system RelE/ParE family toxin [Kofleriaceae bacterium]|jgi:plasmid stabilization system protein ParE